MMISKNEIGFGHLLLFEFCYVYILCRDQKDGEKTAAAAAAYMDPVQVQVLAKGKLTLPTNKE